MAEVTTEATISFDVSSINDAAKNTGGDMKPDNDLAKAMKRQSDLTEEQIRLMKGKGSGSYTNPLTGEKTTNQRVIDYLNEMHNGRLVRTPEWSNKDRSAFFDRNNSQEWADINRQNKQSADNIKKISGIALASLAAAGSAVSSLVESTIGANSYDYENRLAAGKYQAYQGIGVGAGGLIGGLLGSAFGPGGMAAGAFLGGQLGENIGSYFGKNTTVDAAANTQLTALSKLTGGQFENYSQLKETLGSEQKAQDFLGVSKAVMANTTGMAGLTRQAGIEFGKLFTSEFKNTLTPGEQSSTAGSLAALINHSNLGKNSADTAKAVTRLADIAANTGVMPGVIANTALNYQNATGSRDYNAALNYAQLQANQGTAVSSQVMSAQMTEALDTFTQETLLNIMGLSLKDIQQGDIGKITGAIGKPQEGNKGININQLLFNQAGYAYKPFYNAGASGTDTSSLPGANSFNPSETITTGSMSVQAGTIYLSGNIVTSGAGSTEGAMPAKNQSTTPRERHQVATFPEDTSNVMVPPIIPDYKSNRKITH